MKKIISALVITMIFASCQQEVDFPGGAGSGGPGGGGGSGDYQPVTANSEWNYVSTNAGTYKVVSLGTDTTIGGLRYYKFDNVAAGATSRFYVHKSNGVYKEFAFIPQVSSMVELIFLKDSAIGTTWTNVIATPGLPSYHKYTVTGKNLSRTVGSNNFTNVIELGYQLIIDDPITGTPITIGTGKNYYARNVGAIEAYTTVDFMGVMVTDTAKLVSYTIR